MRILMISRNDVQCGVADYGRRVYDILSKELPIGIAEVSDKEQYEGVVSMENPDIILYNYHAATLPFITDSILDRSRKHIAIYHEAGLNFTPDSIINTDIRPLFESATLMQVKNDVPTIGSFGFGFPDKNFTEIARRVKDQFTEAVIRLNIPFAWYGDRDGYLAKREADKVRAELTGTNIRAEINHEYLSQQDLLQFLNGNDINLFLYSPSSGRGLASCTDYALSVYNPIGVSDSEMFRHLPSELTNPDIRYLIKNYLDILNPVYIKHSNKNLIEYYKQCLK